MKKKRRETGWIEIRGGVMDLGNTEEGSVFLNQYNNYITIGRLL